MKLYLVRHATPCVAAYRGFPGPELGELGKMQALQIADFLKNEPIHQVLTSDYTRVLQTLEPFLGISGFLPKPLAVLRERENEVETHDQLVERVHRWFEFFLQTNTTNTAVFSHCGPINMVLEYLDEGQKKLNYSYICPHGCRTPKGGVWVLQIENKQLKNGYLQRF